MKPNDGSTSDNSIDFFRLREPEGDRVPLAEVLESSGKAACLDLGEAPAAAADPDAAREFRPPPVAGLD